MAHIVNRLKEAFDRYAPLAALKIQGDSFSYQQLSDLAWQVAGYLLEKDSTKGCVGIFVQRELSAYQGVLGALFAGRTYVPINPKSSVDKISSIIKQANVSTLIVSAAQYREYGLLFAALGVEHLIVPELGTLNEEDDLNRSTLSVVGADSLIQYRADSSVAYSEHLYIMFTSGSTGVPKGVAINNRNLTSFLDSYETHFNFSPGFIASQTFDFSFDPSVADLVYTWLHGGQVTALTKDELYCPSEYIKRENIQVWASVPALAEFLRQLGGLEDNAFPSIERSIFCGEALTKSLASAWRKAAPNSTVENWYGPTETTIYITHKEITAVELADASANHYVPIGKGLAGHELCVVDADCQLIDLGGKGELVIKGPQLSKGYLGDSKRTDQAFVAMPWDSGEDNRWYKTGDLVWVDSKGDLCYSGRIDNQIKISGRRIELGEIERCLQVYGGVDPVVVVPIYKEDGIVDRLVAYTTMPLDKKQLKEVNVHCRAHLEPIFYPKKIFSIAALPTNHNGKVDRKQLVVDASGEVEPLSV